MSMRIILNKKGMTITEAMVACCILTVGIIALLKIFPQSAVINAATNRLNMAINLAEDKIEEIRAMEYKTLRDAIAGGYGSGVDTVGQVVREYTLLADVPYSDVVQATVRCYWKNPGRLGSSTSEVVTLISAHE
jgi:Tfp pilus assembly protein PilV